MTAATQNQNRSNVSFVELLIGARPSNTSATTTPATPAGNAKTATATKPTHSFLDTFLKAMSAFAV